MWSYYGAKTNLVKLYPRPKYETIIEPFAGSARYSLLHFEKDVLLIDKYPVIIKIWQWLQQCSPNDILKLPRIKEGQNINAFSFDCEEARLLFGFLIGFGFTHPRKIATPRHRHRPNDLPFRLKFITANLFKIRHWKFLLADYTEAPNIQATWFIDPPYQFGGHAYIYGSKKIDYSHLGDWCTARQGQVIVCENTKADWMPFVPFSKQHVLTGVNEEAIWTNEKTIYHNTQIKLFDATA